MTSIIKLVHPVNLCCPVQQDAQMRIVVTFIQIAASGVSQFKCVPSGCGVIVGVTPPRSVTRLRIVHVWS